MKVLIARADRLGDLVLALPVVDMLRTMRADWHLQMLVAPGLEAVVAGHPAVEKVHTWADNWQQARVRQLRADLRAEGFDAVLMLQYRRELALLLRAANAGRIFGPYSKPTSWFLLHGGKRQGRSGSGKHEGDLNLELAGAFAGLSDRERRTTGAGFQRPEVHLTPEQENWAATWRAEEAPGAGRVVFIHPGSGGSALDWGPDRYADVAGKLAALPSTRVFVTGSAADARMVKSVSAQLDPRVGVLLERFTLSQFMGVLAQGDVLVAPSTGPLHLAAAVGTPTVGLFPPAPVMSSARWGQRGPQAIRLAPPVACPEKRRCVREKCEHYNCLAGISADDVVQNVVQILNRISVRSEEPEGGYDANNA